jgi:hypothetical protein
MRLRIAVKNQKAILAKLRKIATRGHLSYNEQEELVSGGWNGIDPCTGNSLISVKSIDGCLIGLAFAFRESCDKNVAVYEALLD